jgi:hypothetical protein
MSWLTRASGACGRLLAVEERFTASASDRPTFFCRERYTPVVAAVNDDAARSS